MPDPDATRLEAELRRHYGAAALAAGSCCSAPELPLGSEVYGAKRYDAADLEALPAEAVVASVGCANPVALADLRPGEVVLDLGSGGGIDVLLAAQRIGPTGRAYGVDMTEEMLELARTNQAKAGVANAEFLGGRIEEVPLPDASVDVVVSNCVVNLSADKAAVFSECYRLLRPGGRLAIADVVADAGVSESLRSDPAAWAACLGGALTRGVYRSTLEGAGFVDVSIEDSHPVADGFTSVLIRAGKAATRRGCP